MLVCCAYSSPLFPYYTSGDSSIFMLIGKGITEGKVMYRDLYDHKGPFLFLIEALGWKIGERSGIWAVECLFTCVSVFMIIKIARLLESDPFLPVMGTAVVYLTYFSRGNTCENYSVPFVYICVYLVLLYMRSGNLEHPSRYAFVYGICFSVLALIRINNATAICCLVLCIMLRLLFHRKFKNLVTNILLGMAGVLVVILPIGIYFYVQNALYDMVFCTFIYNFFYAAAHQNIDSGRNIWLAVISYTPIAFSVMVFGRRFFKDRSFQEGAFFTASVLYFIELVYLSMSIRYQEPALPLYTVALCETFPDFSFSRTAQYLRAHIKNSLLLLFMIITLIYTGMSLFNIAVPFYRHYLTDSCISRHHAVLNGALIIPAEERDSVIGYEIPVSWYIDSGITPCYKYYSMQHWWSKEGLDVNRDFIDYVTREHPMWVITDTEMEEPSLVKTLQQNYTLLRSSTYNYYRYKTP